MTTKSAFSALGAPMSLAWVHESPASSIWHCQNPSKAPSLASVRPASGGCRINFEKKKGRQGSLPALSFGTVVGCKAGARTTAAPYAIGA